MSSKPDVKEIASRMGLREPPEVLLATTTHLNRGHHLAIVAARGSGVEALYARAVLADCAPTEELQALVLAPTRDRAAEVALAIQRGLGDPGLRAAVAPLRADGSLDVETRAVECLVARPSVLLPEVRLGRLRLSELKLLVLDGVADLEELDEWPSVGPLLDTLGSDARRIAVTRRVNEDFLELVGRQLPRGRRWPESVFVAGEPPDPVEGPYPAQIEVAVGATADERMALFLDTVQGSGEVRVRCREGADVDALRAALASAGYGTTGPGEEWDVIAEPASGAGEPPVRAWLGLPLSLEALAESADGRAIAVIDPTHGPQLEILAARSGTSLHHLPGSLPAAELDPLSRYRTRVRSRIERGETNAELLVLEPLLREFGTVRVAAALSDLLRLGGGAEGGVRPWADVEAASRERDAAREARPRGRATSRESSRASEPAHRGIRGAWSRIFIGAGSRDSVRAGDLVGAITGETGIAGAQIGKIEIRSSFSLVEIDSQVVDRVIEKLNGTAIRGRDVTVKPDRAR